MAENKRLVSKEEFLELLEDEEYSPGWQAIDDACDELYNELKPYHFATNMVSRAIFGGEEFLDGYSIYRSPNGYMHIVTYGMTEFIQLVGITDSELEAIMDDPDNVEVLINAMKNDGNPNLVTDMKRTKSYL